MEPKFYTGVGSRRTHPEMLALMGRIAKRLRTLGYTLRSGGAQGSDLAFERGAGSAAHIYLAWPSPGRVAHSTSPTLEAFKMAAAVHPAWGCLSSGARALHARNCHQVLGDDLKTPSRFLVCWTPDGCTSAKNRTRDSGGTATAIVIAAEHGIPVFNLQRPDALKSLGELVNGSN